MLNRSLFALSLIACLGAAPVLAQETASDSTEAETETSETAESTENATEANGLAIGEPVQPEIQVGQTYVRETFTDWELRCIKAAEGADPCQLYQLLKDETGNSVAEINLFVLPEGQEAVAGASVITPLETLLTEQVRLSVDGAATRRYPFSFCTRQGCVSRMGFTPDDIALFKRGAKAQIQIVPVSAPTNSVTVEASLAGFTAGFDALSALRDGE